MASLAEEPFIVLPGARPVVGALLFEELMVHGSRGPPYAAFWDLVRSAIRPGGRVLFVDSLRAETPPEDHTTVRRLNDGREFRIVKIFYEPEVLAAQLADMGWRFSVRRTENHLLYGFGEPRA